MGFCCIFSMLLMCYVCIAVVLMCCLLCVVFAVNPGGWAPPSVVRTIGKRELCKFLKKFSSTVQSRTVSVPLTL